LTIEEIVEEAAEPGPFLLINWVGEEEHILLDIVIWLGDI
jgi:hypothetical protein